MDYVHLLPQEVTVHFLPHQTLFLRRRKMLFHLLLPMTHFIFFFDFSIMIIKICSNGYWLSQEKISFNVNLIFHEMNCYQLISSLLKHCWHKIIEHYSKVFSVQIQYTIEPYPVERSKFHHRHSESFYNVWKILRRVSKKIQSIENERF